MALITWADTRFIQCSVGKSMKKQPISFGHVVNTILLGSTLVGGLQGFDGVGARAREFVALPRGYPPGTIVIKQNERRLYFTTGPGTAVSYPIAIGKAGRAWEGEAFVQGKFIHPAWEAPDVVRHDHPQFTSVIPGGSPRNPMGAAAITLSRPEVAIHGTTAKMRKSVGTAASYGCIRMYNEDVMDLYRRVGIGTPVVSIP